MMTALLVLLTAILVLLVNNLDSISLKTELELKGKKKGGDGAPPEPDDSPRRLGGGGDGKEKPTD